VRKNIRSLKADIVCLIEKRVKRDKADQIKEKIVPRWGFLHNYNSHYLGRIWICWNPSTIKFTLLQEHIQAISCKIESADGSLNWI
jgi:hypothetical protein